jgi:hypothetical protein
MSLIGEKVIDKKFNKVYNSTDVNNWIAFGIKNKYINVNDKDSIIKWVSVLKGKMIEI